MTPEALEKLSMARKKALEVKAKMKQSTDDKKVEMLQEKIDKINLTKQKPPTKKKPVVIVHDESSDEDSQQQVIYIPKRKKKEAVSAVPTAPAAPAPKLSLNDQLLLRHGGLPWKHYVG
jgi:archaellum component FlaD/FlaE